MSMSKMDAEFNVNFESGRIVVYKELVDTMNDIIGVVENGY